ncbi:hypothetical protein MTO96_034595 [Rhipicephalus appendiculatus]
MVEAVRCAGGVLSTEDLSDHLASSEPVLVEPVETTYRGEVTVHTTPLPTHGAVLLETRGSAFNQIAGHPNCVGPRKKPYHSLMPVMVTDARTKDWLCTLGAMGGALQPNILMQVLLNMFEFGMDPQQSVSKARLLLGSLFAFHPDLTLAVEVGFDQVVRRELEQRGHTVNVDNSKLRQYTAGHVNVLCRASQWWTKERASSEDRKIPPDNGPIWCGVETRSSGVALGY